MNPNVTLEMPVTINELMPAVAALSHADKFRLAQLILQQLAQEAPATTTPAEIVSAFEPRRYFGLAHYSRTAVDNYLASAREGWDG